MYTVHLQCLLLLQFASLTLLSVFAVYAIEALSGDVQNEGAGRGVCSTDHVLLIVCTLFVCSYIWHYVVNSVQCHMYYIVVCSMKCAMRSVQCAVCAVCVQYIYDCIV